MTTHTPYALLSVFRFQVQRLGLGVQVSGFTVQSFVGGGQRSGLGVEPALERHLAADHPLFLITSPHSPI